MPRRRKPRVPTLDPVFRHLRQYRWNIEYRLDGYAEMGDKFILYGLNFALWWHLFVDTEEAENANQV